jgi:DNA-binding transcriptional LysR family regulator
MSEIRMLRTFLAIEQHGTMAAAANHMALTHAAVGAQMRTLERLCQRQLFDRSGRSIRLSDAGRSVLEQARAVAAAYDSLLRGVADKDSIEGSIMIGATVSSMGLLAASVIQLKTPYPGLNVRLTYNNSSELERQVRTGEIDAAVIIGEPRAMRSPELWERLYDEPLVLLVNPTVAPADASVASLQAISVHRLRSDIAHRQACGRPFAPLARGGQPGAGNELDYGHCRSGATGHRGLDCAAPAACRVE